ncbi:hypothetical protein EIY72_22380 [Pseudomonas vancouverensis]|uniref:Uncharacterized protein n=1 Tax=Pseudomonas vancouverensis TaxID=95300 RepID=A0A4R4JUC9_PSEVA|nr:hypothetical protein F7R09_24190 [Pseudomonas vancouverensis]TDB58294.1 hypothetical protein EIY72_22380 [Pseudomonas vancouverensis]
MQSIRKDSSTHGPRAPTARPVAAVGNAVETFAAVRQSSQDNDSRSGGDMVTIHIGISGWRYTLWRGGFYSDGLLP